MPSRGFRSLLPPALLLVGIFIVALEPIVLPIGLLVAIGVLGLQTRPPDRPAPSRTELVAGIVAYPAICVVIYGLLRNVDVGAAALVIFPLTALLFALFVGRLWLAVVPVVLAAALLLVGYVNDPSCAACGEDTWGYSAAMTGLLFVAPSVLTVELGVLIYNDRQRRRRQSLS